MEPQLQEISQALVQAVMAACRQAKAQKQDPGLLAQLLQSGTGLGAWVCQALYAPNGQQAAEALSQALETCRESRRLLEELQAAGGLADPAPLSLCGELERLLEAARESQGNL